MGLELQEINQLQKLSPLQKIAENLSVPHNAWKDNIIK